MQSVDASIAVFEIGSLALGYQTLHIVSQRDGVRVIDGSMLAGDRFLLLLEGKVDCLRLAATDVKHLCQGESQDLLLDQELLEAPHPQLIPSLYSLMHGRISDHLLVVETNTVSALLSVGQTLLGAYGLSALELKGTRGMGGKGLGFFTCSDSNMIAAAEAARTKLRTTLRSGRVELIENPSPVFREFFNLSGEA